MTSGYIWTIYSFILIQFKGGEIWQILCGIHLWRLRRDFAFFSASVNSYTVYQQMKAVLNYVQLESLKKKYSPRLLGHRKIPVSFAAVLIS